MPKLGDPIKPGGAQPKVFGPVQEAGKLTRDTGQTAGESLRQVTTPSRGRGRRTTGTTAKERQEAAVKAAAKKLAQAKAAQAQAVKEKALIEKMRKAGIARQAADKAKAKKAKLTRIERNSLKAREQMRITALARGRGFTQKEKRDFMKARGGSISGLRSAKRKGFIISAPKKKEEIKKVEKVKVDPNLLKKVNVKLDKKIKDFLKTERKQEIGGTEQINTSIKTGIETGKFSSQLLNVADIISGGALTERNINKDQADLNKRAIKFNDKFGGKDLSEAEFNKAQGEQKFIDSEQSKLDKRTDSLANSKRDLINDFFAKTSIQGKPRLTVAQQNKIEKERQENKKLQNQIKTNQPVINEISKEISNKSKEIIKLQDKKDRTLVEDVKLFKLKNKVDILSTDIARLEFRAPPKVLAGSFDIIPAARIPSGISKMKFIGNQKVGKGGKIVTDIFFQTKGGRTGIARGVIGEASKDGKTISMVAGRSGKVAVKFPTGTKKITQIESFVGAEKTVSKSKVLDTIATLAKNGEIPQSKAKKLRAIAEDIFKVDIKKIDLKKLNSLERKLIESRKIKPLDLRKNLQRLKKKGLLGIERKIKKPKPKIGKRTRRGIRPKPKVKKVPKRISPKKIAKKFEVKKIETITKKDFIKRIKSFRGTGDITKKQEAKFLKRINRLAKKGKIPKEEFLKIAKKLKKPGKIIKKPKKVKKPKPKIGKKTRRGIRAKPRPIKKKIIKKIETIQKEDFIKRIKSFRGTGDITKFQEKKFIKRINKLSKKGKIPKEEFLKIAKKIKIPKAIQRKPKKVKKIGKKTRGRKPSKPKVPKVPKRISPRKIAKRFVEKKVKKPKPKIGKRTRRGVRPKPKVPKVPKRISPRKIARRFKPEPTPRPTAREPGFDKIIKRLKKESIAARKANRPKKIKSNIKFLEQRGIGRVASVKGKKFIGRLGKKKGIKFDDFSSISSIFTKDELSFIVGKSITNEKAKSEFIGIIRGAKKASTSSIGGSVQQQQFKKALNKVISSVASATAKAEKTKPLKQVTKNIATSAIISRISRFAAKPIIRKAGVKITKPITKAQRARILRIKKLQVSRKGFIAKEKQIEKQISKVKEKIKQLNKQKTKPKTKVKQKAIQKQAQLQKQKLKLSSKTKQVTKQIKKTPSTTRPFRVPRLVVPKIPRKKKRRIVKKKKPVRRKQAYNTFARPLKKSKKAKRPKLIKVNKVPLKKSRAKDVRNFVTDTSLSRTARIRKAKGKIQKTKLKVPVGYAKKTSKKFRRTKRVKGKIIKLPKGKVIERRKRLLDTRGEKNKISLRRRIAQITPKRKVPRKKQVKRKPVRRQKRKPVGKIQARRTIRKVTKRKPVRKQKRKPVRKNPVRSPKRKPVRKTQPRKPIKRRKPKRR